MKNKALQPLLYLSRYNQWANVAAYLFVIVWFVAALTDLTYDKISQLQFWTTYLTLLLFFLPLNLVLAIALVPSFLIFSNFASLLKKYMANEFLQLSVQPEVRKLRLYLIIQFILNICFYFIEALSPKSLPSVEKTEQTIEELGDLGGAMEKFSTVFEYTKWITISLEHAMPLVYLLLLYVALEFNKENTQLRAELDEVI